MRPLSFPLIADENINPDVVAGLRAQGKDITSVAAAGLIGRSDLDVLRHAHSQVRVVVTHDGDFGTLAILRGEPFTGIIHLRPGHIMAAFVLEVLAAIDATGIEASPPFIVVAERKGTDVRLRVRRVGTEA